MEESAAGMEEFVNWGELDFFGGASSGDAYRRGELGAANIRSGDEPGEVTNAPYPRLPPISQLITANIDWPQEVAGPTFGYGQVYHGQGRGHGYAHTPPHAGSSSTISSMPFLMIPPESSDESPTGSLADRSDYQSNSPSPSTSAILSITPPSSGSRGPKRRQVKNACTNCQRACKKCDSARPCLRCVRYGTAETCMDSERKQRPRGVKRGPYKKRGGGEGSKLSVEHVTNF